MIESISSIVPKNPISNKTEYRLNLLEIIRIFYRRIRLKIHFSTVEGDNLYNNTNESYGFKSIFTPKLLNELKEFEHDMFEIGKNIKLRKISDEFQAQLKYGIKKINCSKHIIVNQIKPLIPTKYKIRISYFYQPSETII